METGGGTGDLLRKNYIIGKTIGHGSFAKVKIARHIRTGLEVAIKILNRQNMSSLKMDEKVKNYVLLLSFKRLRYCSVRREIQICRLLVHPHVIRVYEVIETPTNIYVVMEYLARGELFDYIVQRRKLHEDEARHIFQQIIAGVDYCHRNMVVHRDLKPENLLMDSKGNVKVTDFGLSNIMRDGHFLRTSCGSPNYAAPEVISGKHYAGPEVDIWSCGIILYALLCGNIPFEDENISSLFKKIKSGRYILPCHNLSSEACDLISKLLLVDPMKRISIHEIRKHHWFKANLPHYLAITPPNITEHLTRLDEKIIQKVLSLGFDRNQLIYSLQSRLHNDDTVAYYLLLDEWSRTAIGCLDANIQEPVGNIYALDESSSSQISSGKQWLVGLQSPARPQEIMAHILLALQGLNVRWKRIGHYNMKCMFTHVIHNPESANMATNNHMNSVVKFEMQLYKSSHMEYVLDLQRLNGPVFIFLDFCALFMKKLEVF